MTAQLAERGARIVWVDDEPNKVDKQAQALDALGWEMSVVHPGSDTIEAELGDAEGILLDLRWTEGRGTSAPSTWKYSSARRLAQNLTARSPEKPILLFSSFFAEPDLVRIEHDFSPTSICGRLDKQKRKTFGVRRDVVVDDIDIELRRLLGERETRTSFAGLRIPRTPDETRPFEIDIQTYLELPNKDRLALSKQADAVIGPDIDRMFAQSQAEWIVAGGREPAVILWGSRADRLSDAALQDLGLRYRTVPYVFSRPDTLS